MKITKAHIQVAILAIGGLTVAGAWLAPSFTTASPSQPTQAVTPATIASTATSPSKAQPETVAPVVKKKPKPHSVTPTLALDANAQKLIKRSEQLAVAKMDSQIAEEKSRTRKANQKENSEGRSDYVPSVAVIEQPYSPPSTIRSPSSQQAIDRVSLSGLFVDGAEASAYLAFDGGQPFLVKAGDSVKGVSITNINGNGVRLKQGARIRVLEGGL